MDIFDDIASRNQTWLFFFAGNTPEALACRFSSGTS